MFVTVQDFNHVPYSVPDAKTVQPDGTIIDNSEFDTFILTAEKDLLITILGVSFYNLLVDTINALPAAWIQTVSPGGYAINDLVLSTDEHVYKSLVADNVALLTDPASWELQADSIWLLLKNGDTYLVGTRVCEWSGIKKMLIPGIYSEWLKATFDNHSNFGIVIANVQNSTIINPGRRIANAWNSMIRLAGSYHSQQNTFYGYAYQKNLLDARFVDVYAGFTSFRDYLDFYFRKVKTINIFNI